ncbi:hypothetical protein [Polaribacter staleyi]|uniref:hypothetical protein n=1 Tax=Polaribacter staleyi TaxID=2022337 RepID=UPI0031B9C49E
MNKNKIQHYINNFRRKISPYLKKDIGLKTIVYPYSKGVLLLFEFGPNVQNKDEYRSKSEKISEVLKKTKITFFGETNDNLTFQGTNTVMFDNNIAIIKDLTDNEWTDKQASDDVSKILTPQKQS